ncbi:MBL fold metallo-hydrolase [Actinomadura napierensis]|uniref:Metallo-beta-lactamase domain-containing protein n=1 Tax=Actinomadura napierensis TaxID=267854 RepID=A0ABP5L9J0_9ACTN
MAWQLDIHTIDVNAGESSLIIAEDTAVPGSRRSLLIDGGLDPYAETVHDKIVTELPLGGPDYILVTHYDIDHSAGITNLLYADNLSNLVTAVAPVPQAVAAAHAGQSRPEILAAVAAATAGALWGSWGATAAAVNPVAVNAANAALAAGAGVLDLQAIRFGVVAVNAHGAFPSPTLIVNGGKRASAARAVAIAAANSIANNDPAPMRNQLIEHAFFDGLASTIPQYARFRTGGRYAGTDIIDIGLVIKPKDTYPVAVAGRTNDSPLTAAPGVNRARILVPGLGSEVLWGGNAPPAGAPVAIVVSGPDPTTIVPSGNAWQGVGQQPANFAGGTQANGVSIGVVIRFNDFLFFTAGDLPIQGEDLIEAALRQWPLPNGANGTLPAPPVPPPLAAFKCGHHGATNSTGVNLLTNLAPRAAFISCGDKYNHPDQPLINRLQGQASIDKFYLTNCRPVNRAHIPASSGNAQLGGGNRSRVAGDNDPNNLAAINRGDLHLRVLQHQSMGAGRQFTVDYWCWAPPAGGAPGGMAQVDTIAW